MGDYVTATGFSKRTLAQIKAAGASKAVALFGAKTMTDDTTPMGQWIAIPADGLANAWDGAQEVYASYDPSSATGAALDRVCALTGVYRIDAAATKVKTLCYSGKDNLPLVLSSGRQARRIRGALVFSLSADLLVSVGSCQDVYLGLSSAPDIGATVSLSTTFGDFSAVVPNVSDADERALETLKLLRAAISNDAWSLTGGGFAQVVSGGSCVDPAKDAVGFQQVSSGVVLRLVNAASAFGVTSFAAFNVVLCGSAGEFACESTGPNTVDAGELSEIVTTETGWESVCNLVAGTTGRDVETDEELRIRRKANLGQGLATDAAILNYVVNHVKGISAIAIVSNRSGDTDLEGRPAHSFEVTVQGGDASEIAAAILHAEPAGIESYGSETEIVVDAFGGHQTIRFTRPQEKPIYVDVEYALYAEEAFPTDGEAELRAALLDWVATNCTTGKDVYSGKLAAVCYNTCAGLGNIGVLLSFDGQTWNDKLLTIDGKYFATLVTANLKIHEAA